MPVNFEAARAILTAHPKIVSAWHFGSTQQGRARPDSDVDLGLLVSEDLTLDDHLQLQASLQEALATDRVDLSLLNRASPILQFEAIRGRNLVCKDLERQVDFVSLTSRRYEDATATLGRTCAWWREARTGA